MGQHESLPSSTPTTPALTRKISDQPRSGELFSPRQRLMLQKSWKKSPRTGLDNVGALIFMKIYQSDRSVGRMFGLQNVAIENLKYQKFFQSHAMTFTRSLDFIVNNLDDVPKIRAFCRRLGAQHVDFIVRGFKLDYWDIFAESMTECAINWEGGVRCRDILVAWRKLISFIIAEMRSAFIKERRVRKTSVENSSPDSIPSVPPTPAAVCGGNGAVPAYTNGYNSGYCPVAAPAPLYNGYHNVPPPVTCVRACPVANGAYYNDHNAYAMSVPTSRRRAASLQPQRFFDD